MTQLQEDGPVMTAGTGGFTNQAAPQGPVAGFDPIMGMKKKYKNSMKQRVKAHVLKRATPPAQPGVMVSDNE